MTVFDLVLRGGSLVDGTGAPARLADVGVLGDRILAVGDLSALDPATVSDVATYLDPARYPLGIADVIVNGRPVILAGAETGERPGRLVRHA